MHAAAATLTIHPLMAVIIHERAGSIILSGHKRRGCILRLLVRLPATRGFSRLELLHLLPLDLLCAYRSILKIVLISAAVY